jgi:hypothetical protein
MWLFILPGAAVRNLIIIIIIIDYLSILASAVVEPELEKVSQGVGAHSWGPPTGGPPLNPNRVMERCTSHEM